eukprot:bmy_22676T0
MDPNEMPAVPCAPPDSTTGLETGAPWGIELGPRRAIRRCARCHNHGITDEIKDQEHVCLFEACKCHKCALFSEHCSILPAESALKSERGPRRKRHLTEGRIRSGTTSRKAHSHAPKASDQASVSASSEWQQQLEAAEALLALKGSSQAPSGSASVLQPCLLLEIEDFSLLTPLFDPRRPAPFLCLMDTWGASPP